MRGSKSGGWRQRAVAFIAASSLISGALAVPGTTVSASPPGTTLVSTDASGAQAANNAASHTPALSADGTYVAFISDGALVPQDTNGVEDVYRKNINTGAIDLVSVNVSGVAAGNGASGGEEVAISDNGARVVFRSSATDLVAGDTNNQTDLFRRDFGTGSTVQVNLGNNGLSGFGPDFFSTSADGNDIAFIAYSSGPNLGNGQGVYVRHVSQSTTTYVSFVEAGGQVAISGDGTKVAYLRTAANAGCPGGGFYELYVWDSANNIANLANRGTSSNFCDFAGILGPDAMSFDGNIMAYWSDGDAYGPLTAKPRAVYAFNLVAFKAGDTANETVRMSQLPDGTDGNADSAGSTNNFPKGAVSADGNLVAFTSSASNLDPAAASGGSFVKNRTNGAINAVSNAADGSVKPVANTTLSSSGDSVGFATSAAGVTINDTNTNSDVFVHSIVANTPPTPTSVSLDTEAFSTLPGFSMLPASAIPPTAIPLDSPNKDDVSDVPLRSVDVASSPLRSVPLRSVPLRSVPLRSVPLRSVTLSEIPLRSVTWESVLATLNPNPFAGVPLQGITLDALFNAFDAQPTATGLNSVSLGDVDLSSTPLRSVALASVLLGATPLRSVPVPGPAATPFGNWCALIQSLGFTCASLGLTQDSPILAVDLAGVPLRSVPLRSVPLRSVDLSAAPLRSVPLRSVFLQDIPLGGLLLNKIDAAKRPNIIDCSAVDCATQTLAQAATANAIVTTASLGTLFDAVNANDLPGSLADLLQGFIDTSNYPWEDLPLAGLQPYADAREAARTVVYRATFATTGNGSAPATLVVDLPAGFRYVPGSSFNDVTYPDPVATGEHLVWTLNAPGGATTTFTFRAYAGFDLASAATSAIAVTMNGVTVSAQGQAPVQVVQDFEGGAVGCEFLCTGNNAPGTAPVLAPNTLLASHIASAGDIDYYRVPVPAKGTRLQVRLGNHSTDADFDVAMLNTATGAPLRSVPLRSVPLRSVPLADNGIDASAATSSLSPETLDDIPVGAAPLRSVSENRSTADEFIATVSDAEPTVPGNDGSVQQYYTLQVTAYNGGLSNSPYVLYVKEWAAPPAPTCSARTFANAGSGVAGAAPALPSGLNTLYLVNQKRMGDTFGATDTNSALNALRNSLSNRADLGITGVVYPVESSAAAAAAYSAWDAAPCSPENANAVFTSIASIVDTVRAQRPTLKNIVVVGGDDIIPFARVADYTQISNESDYSATALLKTGTNRGTPIAASMATQNILTDDPLADVDPIGWLDHTLYVPDLAVGRLVETPADVVAQVNQFTTALGKLDPKSSLTTGYDFLADGSQAVSNSLASRITDGTKRKTLINETWAKSDELAALFPAAGSPDVASLNAHYDHYRSLPALGNSTQDESDLVTTADIALHPQTLSKRILFTMGCHAGLSMPAAYADDAAKGSDWAQNYLGSSQKAAVYLANTGFGYGDTAAVALSEQLMNEFAKRLDGSMSVGEAAVYAKQAYFGQLGAYGPYDEKAMQEATFYGFPMWKMATAPAAAPANAGLTPSADATGVLSAPVSVSPTFSQNTSKGGGTFFTATAPNVVSSGLQVTQYRPIVPKVSVDVTPNSVPAGTLAHGVFLTSLQSHDVAAVPAVARPTIDLTVNEPPPPAGDVAFPTSFNTLTQFNTPTGPRQQAVLLPGQFFRDASWANAGGVERLFDGIGAEVKYANSGDFTPPQLTNVNAVLAGGQLTISLDTADAAGTVKRVAVLVKDGSGQWTLHALTVDPSNPNHYSAVFAVTGTNFEYLAESQDSNGNVGFTTNKGRYFTGVPVPLAGATPKLVIDPGQPTGTNGWYVNGVSVSLQGKPGVAYTKSVDGGAATSYTGPFSVNTDGNHTVKATGNDGSSATLVVVIDKAAPSINAATDRAANANGWYNAPVTVSFACTDVTSGIRSCSPSTQVNTDGAAVATVGTALDFAGNTNSVTKTIKLDQVQPTVTVGGVANNAVYTVGSVPTPTCTVTDSLSGPAGCTTSVTGGAANGVGTYTYVAVGTDKAGNSRSVSVTYRVLYRWDGFQQPINDTGHEVNETTSVFKAGSNVPVKFQLKRADGSLVSANSTPLFMTPVQGGRTSLPLNESDYIAPPSAGGTFTLDGDHYQYNWKTDKAQAGYYWRIGVMLDDGTIQTVNIALR